MCIRKEESIELEDVYKARSYFACTNAEILLSWAAEFSDTLWKILCLALSSNVTTDRASGINHQRLSIRRSTYAFSDYFTSKCIKDGVYIVVQDECERRFCCDVES